MTFDWRLQLGDGPHGADHGSAARHVVLHLLHAVGGLDGDSPGIEGDALPDQAEHGPSWSVGRFVFHDDERGRLVGTLRDAEEGAHLQLAHLLGAVDLALQPDLPAHGRGPLAQNRRREAIAGLIDQLAGKVLGLSDDHAFAQACFCCGMVDGFGRNDLNGLDAAVFAVGAVRVGVVIAQNSAFGERANGEFRIKPLGDGHSDGNLAQSARLGEADRDARTFAHFVDGQLGGFSQADDQQPFRFETRWRMQQERLRGFGLEFAAVENGLGGLGRGIVAGQEANFGTSRFVGVGVDGENGEDLGCNVGGGGEKQFCVHLNFWGCLPDHFNARIAAKDPVAGDNGQLFGEGGRQNHAVKGVAVMER